MTARRKLRLLAIGIAGILLRVRMFTPTIRIVFL